jgi:SAM-dependent methyltransferase
VSDTAGPATPEPGAQVSPQWAAWRRSIDLTEYESRFVGAGSHGEADFVESLGQRSVLDAGCGAGRLAVELDRRGLDVTGVDLDDDMIALARRHAPHIAWAVADLAAFDLGRRFDVVAMAGNVMLYCRVEDRASVVRSCAAHLVDGGLLVAGFGLREITVDEYDAYATDADLELAERWSTWDRAPFVAGGNYAVSVHRRIA